MARLGMVRRGHVAALSLAVVTAPAVATADSRNVEFLGRTLPALDAPVDLAVVGGRVYLAGNSGLAIVDPSSERVVAFWKDLEVMAALTGVAVSGGHAYLVGWGYDAGSIAACLTALDVSIPARPSVLGRIFFDGQPRAVTVSGRYAYVATDAGVRIVDVADPSDLAETGGFYEALADLPYDVAVDGQHAYVAYGNAGLRVLDVADPLNPVAVGRLDSIYAWRVEVDGPTAYVADWYVGVRVVDVTDPSSPRQVGAFPTGILTADVAVAPGRLHVVSSDLHVLDVSVPAAPVELGRYPAVCCSGQGRVAVDGTTVYVGGALDAVTYGGLAIVDASQPGRPALLGRYYPPRAALDLAVAGRYAYVVDGASLRVVDVQDPRAPAELAIRAGDDLRIAEASGVAVAGPHAFVAAGASGLRVVDVSNPLRPRAVGAFDTPDAASGVAVSGSTAYVADGTSGLRIVDVSDPTAPRGVGFFNTRGTAVDVALAGRFAYVADGAGGIQVVDVSHPDAPRGLAAVDLAYASDVAVSGSRLYAVEPHTHAAGGRSRLHILDLTDPAAPIALGAAEVSTGMRLAVSDDFAYVATAYQGFRVIDVSDPGAPAEAGFYEVYPGNASGVAVSESYVFLAEGTEGLRIYRFAGQTATVVAGAGEAPGAFALDPSFPNPFNAFTEIGYHLDHDVHVTLALYDALGQRLALLVDGPRPAGRHRVVLADRGLASGVYLYRLEAGGRALTKKLTVAR